jgi:hypothetical protein
MVPAAASCSNVECLGSAATIWQRLAGTDSGHGEHRMQGALHSGPLLDRLGLTSVQREYPAWRGARKPGFLDFLGIDRDNRLHIVETKANPDDVTVVMQTLDYAIWVLPNGAAIRDERGWAKAPAAERVVIDFICAPPARKHASKAGPHGYAIGRYLAGQLEVLSPAICWRIWLVPDPLADPPDLIGPVSRACRTARWARNGSSGHAGRGGCRQAFGAEDRRPCIRRRSRLCCRPRARCSPI